MVNQRKTGALILAVAAAAAMLAVAMGAFAAHGLKAYISVTALNTIKTAVLYQFIHSIAVILCVLLAGQPHWQKQATLLINSARLFLLGVVLFSGSLYALSLFEWRFMGPITPIGGLAFIAGWLCLTWCGLRGYRDINDN
ncbi:DUF423 domain-containing protein [Alteromonas facilis]|uniref:DUF423 domain-containing protein n=1 Tax=Alteromonas facilis TaxID=2048004 RepID=UPI000C2811FF|nr:DUF423 domain-containing protein [Alteromonas facilis]